LIAQGHKNPLQQNKITTSIEKPGRPMFPLKLPVFLQQPLTEPLRNI